MDVKLERKQRGDVSINKGRLEQNKIKDITTQKMQPKDDKSKGKISNIQCFWCLGYGHRAALCPNARIMTMRNGDLVSEDEKNDEDSDDMPPLEDALDGEGDEFAPQG